MFFGYLRRSEKIANSERTAGAVRSEASDFGACSRSKGSSPLRKLPRTPNAPLVRSRPSRDGRPRRCSHRRARIATLHNSTVLPLSEWPRWTVRTSSRRCIAGTTSLPRHLLDGGRTPPTPKTAFSSLTVSNERVEIAIPQKGGFKPFRDRQQ